MIDQRSRAAFALSLRQFAAGRITNDEFEDRIPRHSSDPAVRAIADAAWFLYSDLRTYRLRGRNRLPKSTRGAVSRCILFLATDLPYEWPVERRSIARGLAYFVANLFTLGAIARRHLASWRRQPNSELWPFFRPVDYQQRLAHPPFLSGRRGGSR